MHKVGRNQSSNEQVRYKGGEESVLENIYGTQRMAVKAGNGSSS
jgi:hypothetical protein